MSISADSDIELTNYCMPNLDVINGMIVWVWKGLVSLVSILKLDGKPKLTSAEVITILTIQWFVTKESKM